MARIYQPLQRVTDGRWNMTVSSDEENWTHTIGFCCGKFDQVWKPYSGDSDSLAWPTQEAYEAERARHAAHARFYHDNGHATADQALDCYRRYDVLLHRREYFEQDVKKPCVVCNTWTMHRVLVGTSLPTELVLCIAHCTTWDVYRALRRPDAGDDNVPRRNRVDWWTPAEAAIQAAVDAVEAAGAHPLLTDAVNLLSQARGKVADFVDGGHGGMGQVEP